MNVELVERSFPLYRKYPNNKSYFKVLSAQIFEEVQMIGKYYRVDRFEVKILPDRNLISDMIDLSQGHWVETDKVEFESVLAHCQAHLILAEWLP